MLTTDFTTWLLATTRPPLVMGVLNVTPDSFSDGGRYVDVATAAAHARQLAAEGADLIDIGGESTRPGSARIPAAEQIRRIVPVLEAIKEDLPAVVSVDTTQSAVAAAALDHGASVINDISAGTDDPRILSLAAERGVPIILMHMQGRPATMQAAPHYEDVVAEVRAYLAERIAAAEEARVAREKILVDPGIGFGKTAEHNLLLLRELRQLTSLGRPVVVGTSRKGFISRITGETEPAARLWGTAATVAWSIANGAALVRVHDVKPMGAVVRMVRAIQLARLT